MTSERNPRLGKYPTKADTIRIAIADAMAAREPVNPIIDGLLDQIDEQATTIRRFQEHARIEREWRQEVEAAERKRRQAVSDLAARTMWEGPEG